MARSGRLDFDERDRLLLELARLQLVLLDGRLRAQRTADTLLGLMDAGLDGGQRGIVLPGLSRQPAAVSAVAQDLLQIYFGWRSGSRLPAPIAAWLARGGDELASLRVPGRSGTLVVSDAALSDGRAALILHEEGSNAAQLSPREHEILRLVAEGLTNSRIAERLWISPGTVRKHLENAFVKLGVSTRTAAVAALGRLASDRQLRPPRS